jgi:hypothetical protein
MTAVQVPGASEKGTWVRLLNLRKTRFFGLRAIVWPKLPKNKNG